MKNIKKITKRSQNKTIKSVISTLDYFIKENEKYKNSYFWNSSLNATNRRFKEFKNSFECEILGDKLNINTSLTMTCKNVYYKKEYILNNENKDLRAVKKLLRSLEKIVSLRGI
jgi:hypothetical protein